MKIDAERCGYYLRLRKGFEKAVADRIQQMYDNPPKFDSTDDGLLMNISMNLPENAFLGGFADDIAKLCGDSVIVNAFGGHVRLVMDRFFMESHLGDLKENQ